MKSMTYLKTISLFCCIVFLFSCGGSSYNTDYLPPNTDADVKDIFPKTIVGLENEVAKMDISDTDYRGVRATYGEGEIKIEIVRNLKDGSTTNYIENFLYSKIDAFPNNSRVSVNGNWTGKGSDDKTKLFAWVNEDWIFLIESKKSLFDEVIVNFDYISEY